MKRLTSDSQPVRHSFHSGLNLGNCILIILGAITVITGFYSAYIKHSDKTDWVEKKSLSFNKGLSSQVIPKFSTKTTLQKTAKTSDKDYPISMGNKPSANEPTYSATELIDLLAEIKPDDLNSELSPEDNAAIRDALRQLALQGEAAIPAIISYLNSLDDVDYLNMAKQSLTGFASLRLALFDVLHQIGGKEVEAIFAAALQRTRTPAEILHLGRYLNEYDAKGYRNQILKSALTAFNSATNEGIDGHDAGPIFQILQEYGGEDIVAKLEQVPQLNWGQYASVALSNLPGGMGIPSLARQVQNAPATDLSARFALKMLAQSADYPAAQSALIASVANNQIPGSLWPEFAEIISGTYQVQFENPNNANDGQSSSAIPHSVNPMLSFTPGGGQVLYGVRYSAPNLSMEQIEQRMQLISELLEATDDPEAISALDNSYQTLKAISATVVE